MAKNKLIDVSFSNGFVHGRAATTDESEGYGRTVAGRHVRLRVSDVVAYIQAEEGTLEIILRVSGEDGAALTLELVGSLEAMDRAIGIANMRLVERTVAI